MGYYLFEGSPYAFLMNLGYLPAGTDLTLRTEIFGKLLERLHHPIGRLVEYHGASLSFKTIQSCGTSFLLRQETFKAKPVARQA